MSSFISTIHVELFFSLGHCGQGKSFEQMVQNAKEGARERLTKQKSMPNRKSSKIPLGNFRLLNMFLFYVTLRTTHSLACRDSRNNRTILERLNFSMENFAWRCTHALRNDLPSIEYQNLFKYVNLNECAHKKKPNGLW